MSEFNLSDKIATTNFETVSNFIRVKDVREFLVEFKKHKSFTMFGGELEKWLRDRWDGSFLHLAQSIQLGILLPILTELDELAGKKLC